jgi:hypothetical protein
MSTLHPGLQQWLNSNAIARHKSDKLTDLSNFSSNFNLFSPPAIPALSPPLFLLVRPFLACCCSDEVDD